MQRGSGRAPCWHCSKEDAYRNRNRYINGLLFCTMVESQNRRAPSASSSSVAVAQSVRRKELNVSEPVLIPQPSGDGFEPQLNFSSLHSTASLQQTPASPVGAIGGNPHSFVRTSPPRLNHKGRIDGLRERGSLDHTPQPPLSRTEFTTPMSATPPKRIHSDNRKTVSIRSVIKRLFGGKKQNRDRHGDLTPHHRSVSNPQS